MPVLAIFTGKLTKDQYDTLRKEVDWENKHPEGGICHAASFDDSGNVHVADVWKSAETLNAFAEGRLMPAFAKLGIQPPSVSVYPTHKILVYPAAEDYQA